MLAALCCAVATVTAPLRAQVPQPPDPQAPAPEPARTIQDPGARVATSLGPDVVVDAAVDALQYKPVRAIQVGKAGRSGTQPSLWEAAATESFVRSLETRVGRAAVGAVAGALGPSVGAGLVDRFGWRSAFFVHVPVGVIALIRTIAVKVDTEKHIVGSLPDMLGIGLAAVTLGASALVLAQGRSWGLADPRVTGLPDLRSARSRPRRRGGDPAPLLLDAVVVVVGEGGLELRSHAV